MFCNDAATTEICTLSLRGALPICTSSSEPDASSWKTLVESQTRAKMPSSPTLIKALASAGSPICGNSSSFQSGSEEHTAELQSRQYLVCRLLLCKKYLAPTTLSTS